jgi:hypothetical protein
VDVGVLWNIVDNIITGNAWLGFTEKHNRYKLNIFHSSKASSGENRLVYVVLTCICHDILLVYVISWWCLNWVKHVEFILIVFFFLFFVKRNQVEIQSFGHLPSLRKRKGTLLLDVSAPEICYRLQEPEKSTPDVRPDMHKISGSLCRVLGLVSRDI